MCYEYTYWKDIHRILNTIFQTFTEKSSHTSFFERKSNSLKDRLVNFQFTDATQSSELAERIFLKLVVHTLKIDMRI